VGSADMACSDEGLGGAALGTVDSHRSNSAGIAEDIEPSWDPSADDSRAGRLDVASSGQA
jgi:hypothetical protein